MGRARLGDPARAGAGVRVARGRGGLAVGAVITDAGGAVIPEGRNRAYDPPGGPDALEGTPLAHAEMNAFAAVRTERDLAGCTLLSTQIVRDMVADGLVVPVVTRGRSLTDLLPPDGTASSPPPPPAPPAPKDGSHPPGEGRLGHRRLLWASRSIWWPGRPAGSRCRRGDLPRGIVRGVMSRLARQLLYRYEPHRMD
jgi:hypothetical protein